jgi:hypothetical protein
MLHVNAARRPARALRPYAGDHHWWLTRRTLAELAALRGDAALALAIWRRRRARPDGRASCPNRAIAEVLVISEHTVVNHLSRICAKIGVDNRTGAAAFALRQGIV